MFPFETAAHLRRLCSPAPTKFRGLRLLYRPDVAYDALAGGGVRAAVLPLEALPADPAALHHHHLVPSPVQAGRP